ncbi:MAG: HNH endonuclease [Methylococcaceae bacterium]
MKHDYCVACGIREKLHQHHLVPKSRGGSNDQTNLITLCVDCHEKIHRVNNSLIKLSAIAREKKKREGKVICGHPPYGKMKTHDGYLVDNPIEQEIIKKICELKVSLCCGSETIINELERLGYKTRKGERFKSNAILRILREKGLQQNGYIRFHAKNTKSFDDVIAEKGVYSNKKPLLPKTSHVIYLKQSETTLGQTYEIF